MHTFLCWLLSDAPLYHNIAYFGNSASLFLKLPTLETFKSVNCLGLCDLFMLLLGKKIQSRKSM